MQSDIFVFYWTEGVGSGWHYGRLILLDKKTATVQPLSTSRVLAVPRDCVKMVEKIFLNNLEDRLTSEPESIINKNEEGTSALNEQDVKENIMTTENTTSETTAKTPKVKSNSLTQLGYKIEAIPDGSLKDAQGNEFKFKVISPRGTDYLIKQTKRAGLRAFRKADSKDTVSISGLYAFNQVGADLVGDPLGNSPAKAVKEPVAA